MPSVEKSLELHWFGDCSTELVLASVQLNIWWREIHAIAFLCYLVQVIVSSTVVLFGENLAYYPEAEHPPFSVIVHVRVSVLSVFYFVLGSTSCILRTAKVSPNTSNSTKAISSLSGGLDFCFGLHSGRPTTSCFWEQDLELLRAVSA